MAERPGNALFPKKEEIAGEEFKGDHATFDLKVVPNSQYNTESPEIHRIRIDPVKKDAFYFSLGKSFYYSNDNGANIHTKRSSISYRFHLHQQRQFERRCTLIHFKPASLLFISKPGPSMRSH
ncbi:MAG: hypothetical protein WDO15_15330 [Bacteroidota bacterium]